MQEGNDMKRILLIASLLLISPLCNGQIAGRGLYCETDLTKARNIGIYFSPEYVEEIMVRQQRDAFTLKTEIMSDDYYPDSDSIRWFSGDYTYVFHRKTGFFTRTIYKYNHTDEFNCRVTSNREELMNIMIEFKDYLQDTYDKAREGNIL